MATQDDFDLEAFKKKSYSWFIFWQKDDWNRWCSGPNDENFLESMMTGELEHHISESKRPAQP